MNGSVFFNVFKVLNIVDVLLMHSMFAITLSEKS